MIIMKIITTELVIKLESDDGKVKKVVDLVKNVTILVMIAKIADDDYEKQEP